jgi:hypothetical protein
MAASLTDCEYTSHSRLLFFVFFFFFFFFPFSPKPEENIMISFRDIGSHADSKSTHAPRVPRLGTVPLCQHHFNPSSAPRPSVGLRPECQVRLQMNYKPGPVPREPTSRDNSLFTLLQTRCFTKFLVTTIKRLFNANRKKLFPKL